MNNTEVAIRAQVDTYNSRQARKEYHTVEPSNKNFISPRINMVIAPERPQISGGNPRPNMPPSMDAPEKKKNSKRNAIIIAGVSALAIAGIAVGVGANSSSGSGEKPPEATSSSAPVDTGEEQPVETEQITPESLVIGSDLLSDPNSLMETVVEDRITDWINAGATPENAKISREEGFNEQVAFDIAAKYDEVFINSLLVPDWQSNPQLVELVAKITETHRDTLRLYFVTSAPDLTPEDIAPYMREGHIDSIDSVIANNDGSVSITYTEHETDNKDQNTVGEVGTTTGVDGIPVSPTMTFVTTDNGVKLSDIIFG